MDVSSHPFGVADPRTTPPAKKSSRGRSETPQTPGIAHTLTACTRCRQRKSRCDPGIPRCEPCQRSNAHCVYYDPARNITIPRTYILQLRDKIRKLKAELNQLDNNETDQSPDAEIMAREAGLIKFKENDESRFLGPSSGIAITRFVMEMAKQNTDSKSIKEVVNETTAQEIKTAFNHESQKPTSKIYPLVSSVAQPNLPPPELTYKLVDIFMAKAQYMLPTLHEPAFRRDVDAVLNGSQDHCQNFQVRLVIAISMQKISTDYAGLADSFYLAALPFLDASIRRMDLATLQCFALMAQYSLLTPTRTAAYWVVGVAAKLCQDLGLTDESTITKSASGRPLDCLEVDMRRRLFWIITSMEYGLSHSLGRPSAFCVTHDNINVKFFEMVDDRFITPGGVIPGNPTIMKKCIAIHFFKMRLLQAEIRRTLYLRKRPTPVDDRDPWFTEMLDKLDHWVASCPKNDEGSGLSELWFHGRRNTMIVFMYRPSPQVPEPSLQAAQRCYDACVFNVKMHKQQVDTNSVDLTWIFTQSVFMALNTILWSLSYPGIRHEHPAEEVIQHISIAMEVIAVSAKRWPGVESAAQLYKSLIAGCLKAYGSDESFVVHSPANPSNGPSPSSSNNMASPRPVSGSPASVTARSVATSQTYGDPTRLDPGSANNQQQQPVTSSFNSQQAYQGTNQNYIYGTTTQGVQNPPVTTQVSAHTYSSDLGAPQAQTSPQFQYQYNPSNPVSSGQNVNPNISQADMHFNPHSPYNPFPSAVPGMQPWDPNSTVGATTPGPLASFPNVAVDPTFWMGSIGDQYSQFFNQPYTSDVWRNRSLTQDEHVELMENLAQNIPEMAPPLNETTALYSTATP